MLTSSIKRCWRTPGKSIDITTPYFLPDRSTLNEIVKAVSERGVKVRVITPGKHSNHLIARASSRRRYGELLKAGAEIYEFQPSMIHAKTMVIDAQWSVVGSTNFDNRSFGLNDEVNVAVRDREMALRLEADFGGDLQRCRRMTYDDWKNRSMLEKTAGAVLSPLRPAILIFAKSSPDRDPDQAMRALVLKRLG